MWNCYECQIARAAEMQMVEGLPFCSSPCFARWSTREEAKKPR